MGILSPMITFQSPARDQPPEEWLPLSAPRWRGRSSMSGLLFGVTPTDVPTFAAVVSVLVGTCLLASYLPARRAARVDPILSMTAGRLALTIRRRTCNATVSIWPQASRISRHTTTSRDQCPRAGMRRLCGRRILTLAHRGVTQVRGKDRVHPESFVTAVVT